MNSNKNTSIFIVDDNKVFTLALKADIETSFSQMAIKIHCFETGEKCMEKFIQVVPDLVILDYHLNTKYPDAADGIKVLDWIKNEHVKTDVIMLTADDNLDVALKSFHHGATDYVVKSDTKFTKINYALFNHFKMIELRDEAKTYKRLLMVLSISAALLLGGVLSYRYFMI